MKGVLGRIVKHEPEGSAGFVNGVKVWSIVLFCTPHGTTFKTGIFHLHQLTEEEKKQLYLYEADAIEKDQLYTQWPEALEKINYD